MPAASGPLPYHGHGPNGFTPLFEALGVTIVSTNPAAAAGRDAGTAAGSPMICPRICNCLIR